MTKPRVQKAVANSVPYSHVPWTAVIAVVSAALSFVYSYAVQGVRLDNVEKEVVAIKLAAGQTDQALYKISATLERIDERLKYVMTPQRR